MEDLSPPNGSRVRGHAPSPKTFGVFVRRRWCILIATDVQQDNVSLQNCASGSTSDYSRTQDSADVNISRDIYVNQGVWGTEVPQRVQGRSPGRDRGKSPSWVQEQSHGRGSGDEVPEKLKYFCI